MTSAADAVVIVFTALAVEGQEEVIERLSEARLRRLAGEEVEPFSRLYRYFGSWPRAREALELSDTNTPRRIEARFRYRQLGKVWRYTEDTLRETLTAAGELSRASARCARRGFSLPRPAGPLSSNAR